MAGTIYVLQMGVDGPVKVGFTRGDPSKRLKQLQTGNPLKLRLVATCEGTETGERLIHEAFADTRLEGEWFASDPRIAEAVEAIRLHANGFDTIPPKTQAGRDQLAMIGARKRYPDGSIHASIDWDELAIFCSQDIARYAAWEAAQ